MGSATEKVMFCTWSFSGVLELHCRIGTLLCDPSTGSRCLNPALPDKTQWEEMVFPVSLTIKAFILNAGSAATSQVSTTYRTVLGPG